MADRIIVIGSLNPEKECQDRVRVLSGGGYLSSDKGDRLQGPAKGFSGIYDSYNKAVYNKVSPTLLSSDYKHCKYVIEEI